MVLTTSKGFTCQSRVASAKRRKCGVATCACNGRVVAIDLEQMEATQDRAVRAAPRFQALAAQPRRRRVVPLVEHVTSACLIPVASREMEETAGPAAHSRSNEAQYTEPIVSRHRARRGEGPDP